MKIEISDRALPTFWAYLGIGILEAILNETVSPDTGIWTIGMPRIWEPLEKQEGFPLEIIKIFQTCDELSFIKEHIPDKFHEEVQELLDRLHRELAKLEEPDYFPIIVSE